MSHPLEVQQRILDAAFTAFATDGAEATLSQIAEAADVGRATLYRYFPGGRESLIDALLTRETLILLGELATAMDGHEDDSPRDLLHLGLRTAYENLRAHPVLRKMLIDQPEVLLPHFTVGAAPVVELGVEFITPYINRGIDAGRIPQLDSRHAAEWLVRFILSLVVTPPVTADADDPSSMDEFLKIVTRPLEVLK